MLYLFDLDGTLISSYMDNPDKDYHCWQVLPGRKQKLATLRRENHQLGLVTNQAGVAFGHVSEDEVRTRIIEVLGALDLPEDTPYEVCFGHRHSPNPHYRKRAQLDCRKPRGTMLRTLVNRFPADATEGALYVGDRPEDLAAALDARVSFAWAESFFATG